MKESEYYEELANVTRTLAESYEEVAYEKERAEVVEGNFSLLESSYESLVEGHEQLVQQIDDMGEQYTELKDLIVSFDEPAFNLIDQLLVNSIPNAAIPDYVNVVRRLMRLLYEKGIELKETPTPEFSDEDDEGVLYG